MTDLESFKKVLTLFGTGYRVFKDPMDGGIYLVTYFDAKPDKRVMILFNEGGTYLHTIEESNE